MIEVYEIRMSNLDPNDKMTQLIIRTEGLNRTDAIVLAEEVAKTHGNFDIHSIIAGPKMDLNK